MVMVGRGWGVVERGAKKSESAETRAETLKERERRRENEKENRQQTTETERHQGVRRSAGRTAVLVLDRLLRVACPPLEDHRRPLHRTVPNLLHLHHCLLDPARHAPAVHLQTPTLVTPLCFLAE